MDALIKAMPWVVIVRMIEGEVRAGKDAREATRAILGLVANEATRALYEAQRASPRAPYFRN